VLDEGNNSPGRKARDHAAERVIRRSISSRTHLSAFLLIIFAMVFGSCANGDQQGPKSSIDSDVAALDIALNTAGNIKHDHGKQNPPGLSAAEGDCFAITPAQIPGGNDKAITLWIMGTDYSAIPQGPTAKAAELDRWNHHRVFATGDFGSYFGKQVQERLSATAGPLVAAIVVVPGTPDSLAFEVRNRSDKPVRVFKPLGDGIPGVDEGWNICECHLWPRAWKDRPGTEQLKAQVFTMSPGQRQEWPMRIQVNEGTDAKIDADYALSEADASEFGPTAMWLVAPTVRLKIDAQHKMTVQPWIPAPLSTAEAAKSARLAAIAEPWLGQLRQIVMKNSGNLPESFVTRDQDGHVSQLTFQTEEEAAYNRNSKVPMRIEAKREGDWHGLSLADTMDPIKWDGAKTRREYRVPGSDWILTSEVDKDVPKVVQDVVDESFNAFLHAEK
jgi:hypothetical protein